MMQKTHPFQRFIGETSISVFRDGVLFKPWHLYIRSDPGAAHQFFWTRKQAVRFAEWLSTIISDALDAKGV